MELDVVFVAAPHHPNDGGAVRQREIVMNQPGWFAPHRTLHLYLSSYD